MSASMRRVAARPVRGGWRRSVRATATPEKAALLELVAPAARRGVGHTKAQRAALETAVDALVAAAPSSATGAAAKKALSAAWRLLWTSERETLFLLDKGLFGREAGESYQTIDVAARTLSNTIEFADGAEFAVESTIELEEGARVAFRFTSAGLRLPRLTLPLPPFGQGWFDNVYVDDTLRISRDSRGDTLVVTR